MKQITWIYFVLAGLAAAFTLLSIAIYLLGPRPSLLSPKLRLGAMIIAFNTMLAGCHSSNGDKEPIDGEIMCYDMAGDSGTGDSDAGDSDAIDTDTIMEPIDTDIMCYDVECYDIPSDSDTIDTDTAETPIDTGALTDGGTE